VETTVVIPAQGMAGKRTQTMEENMATKAELAILQDLVRMDGIPTAKTQFGATMMTRTMGHELLGQLANPAFN